LKHFESRELDVKLADPSPGGIGRRSRTGHTCLWLIRHAEVEARYQGLFGGRVDIGLSPRGHEQAAALAAYLRQKSFHAIYASPMKRVQQTLGPVIVNCAPKPVVLADLREVDMGDWTELRFEELPEKFGVSAEEWLTQLEQAAIPNAESAATLRARVEPCLDRIIRDHGGQHVAIFCHGGVIRMLLAILLEVPLSRTGAFEIDYASITQVLLRPARVRVQLLNFAPWRDSL